MTSKRVAIVQSNYIPWKGYFDLIARVDEFIIYDDVQYTRRDWRNRNRIKTPHGTRWLTIPVKTKGRYYQRIDETELSDPGWAGWHWETIVRCYSDAPCFDYYEDALRELYRSLDERLLTHVNERITRTVCGMLGIDTVFSGSDDHALSLDANRRIVALCQRAGADEYVSGPTGKGYLDEALLADAGITVSYMDYSGYPEYPQVHPPFDHRVCIVDLLLHTGPEAPRFMKYVPDHEKHRS